jgi:hypothetical protein
MQIEDLVKAYYEKSDEELMRLGASMGHLTAEAQLALRAELSRRHLNVEEEQRADDHAITGRPRIRERQDVVKFVAEVLSVYHARFWLFFNITVPAVIISTAALIMRRRLEWEIARQLPRGMRLSGDLTALIEATALSFSVYLISWMVFSLAFATICVALEEAEAGYKPSAWSSLANVCEKRGAFLGQSVLLLFLMLAAVAASSLAGLAVVWALRQWVFPRSGFALTLIFYVAPFLGLLVLSRLALAIPAIVLDDFSVWQAMLRSIALTRGRWLTLAALLAKSLVGGYVAGMLPFWLVSQAHLTTPMPSWFPWFLTSASVIGVTVAEPPMFIGFALMYLKASGSEPRPEGTLAGPAAV